MNHAAAQVDPGSRFTLAQSAALCGVLAAACLPVLLDPTVVGRVSALHRFAESANPYFVWQHAGLLYVWMPLVVLSGLTLLMSPGLLLALSLNGASTVGKWLAHALALSIPLLTITVAGFQWQVDSVLRSRDFGLFILGLAGASAVVLALRAWRGKVVVRPWHEPSAHAKLLQLIAAAYVLIVALLPKLFWESFNGDGAQDFECARLLIHQAFPFFAPGAGAANSFPGMTTMLFAFPGSWFVRLFGEVEASARLPFVLFVVAAHGLLVAAAQTGNRRAVTSRENLVIWLGLAPYTLAMAFSATYSPYFADVASPATQDTLLMVAFLGFFVSVMGQQRGWMLLFAILAYWSQPSGGLLMALMVPALLVCARPVPWRQIGWIMACLVATLLLSQLLPRVLAWWQHPLPGGEHGILALARRFAYLQIADLQRILFVVVPAGIVPVFWLFRRKRLDQTAAVLALVCLVYFGVFYIQAYSSFHHYVPCMLLPIAVFWRAACARPHTRSYAQLATVGALFAVALSLPAHWSVDVSNRQLGASIENRFSGYRESNPQTFRSTELMYSLFPPAWDERVPNQVYGGDSMAWNLYSFRRTKRDPANYVIQPVADAAPVGGRLQATNELAALYVLSEPALRRHQAMNPPNSVARIYRIERGMLFGYPRPHVVSLPRLARRLGVPVDQLRDWIK